MVGYQITLEELCSTCLHELFNCDKHQLYDKIDYADGSYSCENHLEATKEDDPK